MDTSSLLGQALRERSLMDTSIFVALFSIIAALITAVGAIVAALIYIYPHLRKNRGKPPAGVGGPTPPSQAGATPPPANVANDSPVGIITRFTASLTRRLQIELGDGWWVWDSVQKEGLRVKAEGEVVSFGKNAWNSVEPNFRVALAYDDGMPGKVYFTVRGGLVHSYTPRHPEIGIPLVNALTGEYQRGRGGVWWPRWWVWPTTDYRDWSNSGVLHELGKLEADNHALRYFVSQLTGMARTVEPLLDEWLMRHAGGSG